MMVVSLLLGRTLDSQLSDDMKSRIAECQKSCDDLKQKFGARLAMNTNRQGTRIEGDAKEIKGDVKEIKGNIDKNSKCRIHNDGIPHPLIMMFVDANIQITLKTIKDDQLGSYEFRFCLTTLMSYRCLLQPRRSFDGFPHPTVPRTTMKHVRNIKRIPAHGFSMGRGSEICRRMAVLSGSRGLVSLVMNLIYGQYLTKIQRGAVKPSYGERPLGRPGN